MLEVEPDDGRFRTRLVEQCRDRLVEIRSERLRHRLVHGLADEGVLEAEAVPRNRDVRPDQATADELEHARLRGLTLRGRDQLQDGLEREAAAYDSGALEHGAFLEIQPVEPGVENAPDRAAQLDVLALLAGERGELLDEERVALGELGDALAHGRRRVERVEEPSRVGFRECVEPHGRIGVRHPLRPPLRELRAGEAEEQHRRRREADGEMLDQVEQGLLRPVDVVEHREERPLGGELLEQAPRRREHLVARAFEHGLVPAGRPERLPDRRERRSFAVGRAAGDDDARLAVEPGDELSRQPRLADAGVADDRHEATAARGGCEVGGAQALELLLLADERRVVATRDRRRGRIDGLEPERDRLARLPLQRQGLELGRLHGVPDEAVRGITQHDLARRGGLLEPLSDCDRLAADEPVAGGGIAGHDLAGVDPDPDLEPDFGLTVELRDALLHGDGRAHRAQRVVLVHDRHAEDRHHLVADELLDRPAVALDRGRRPLEEAEHQVPERLGIEPVCQLRIRDEVAEENSDRLAALDAATRERVHVPKVHPRPYDFEVLPGNDVGHAVEVIDLVKRYPKAPVNAVDGVSFGVAAGEVFGLLGPNGAGKTTTVGMLTTRVRPTAGTALVGGVDVVQRSGEARRQAGRRAAAEQPRPLDLDPRQPHLPRRLPRRAGARARARAPTSCSTSSACSTGPGTSRTSSPAARRSA